MSIPVDLEALTANWTPQAKQRAYQEFNARRQARRQFWYCPERGACGGKPHEGFDYPHARADQYPPPGADWFIWAIFSGRGCVDPHTRIYNPYTLEEIPVAELGSSTVLSMEGPVDVDAPFRKGDADLWTVILADGSQITVTDQHKFLTPGGWWALERLERGDVIAAGPSAKYTGFNTRGVQSAIPSHPRESAFGHNNYYRSNFDAELRPELGGNFFLEPTWVTIETIAFSHYGEYWDLHVPGANHYSAEGIWNHNSGKTRTGAEWVRKVAERVERVGMVGRRGVDVRATMVEGESGLIMVCENAGIGYDWQPSKREFTFANGSKVFGYSGEEPDSLRGAQHGAIWLDEPAHMPAITDVWDNALLGLRLPGLPGGAKALITTTPLPTKWIKSIQADPAARVIRASTYENLDNLDPTFRRTVLDRFEGTRRGRQELYGEILPDVEGALWNTELFQPTLAEEAYERVIVAIDPAGTSNRKSDETGIVTVGKIDNEYHVLSDHSGKYSPLGWAEAAIRSYQTWNADAILAEKNFGGDMVRSTIDHALENRHEQARVLVATAARSKFLRAEPVVGLYEQGRVKHVRGLADLETEMVEWVPGKGDSPNRVDALVWAITELAGGRGGPGGIGIPDGDVKPPRLPKFKGKDLVRGIFR